MAELQDSYFIPQKQDGKMVFDAEQLTLPWCESPFFAELLERSNLSESQRKFVSDFARDGYAIIDPEIVDLDAYAEDIRTNLFNNSQKPVRIQDAWLSHKSDAVKNIACAPKVLDYLRLIYRREPIPFQTLNFPVGTQQDTHSDTIHFDSIPHRFMCGVWLALEDIDGDNGPLHYYPGSHKLPIYDMHTLGFPCTAPDGTRLKKLSVDENYQYYIQFVQKLMEAQGFEKKELHIKKGQALIWSANLFHGGQPIKDPARTRMSQVSHYYFEGCMYYTPLTSDMATGNVFWRNRIRDIRTGENTPQVYLGQRFTLPEQVTFEEKQKEAAAGLSLKSAPGAPVSIKAHATAIAREIKRRIAG